MEVTVSVIINENGSGCDRDDKDKGEDVRDQESNLLSSKATAHYFRIYGTTDPL